MSIFGFTFAALNSFEMIYMFVNKLKKSSALYQDNLALQKSIEHYKKFI